MGAQSAPAQGQAADMPDGFGVAVVREDGKNCEVRVQFSACWMLTTSFS
jgi:hypothetical protein